MGLPFRRRQHLLQQVDDVEQQMAGADLGQQSVETVIWTAAEVLSVVVVVTEPSFASLRPPKHILDLPLDLLTEILRPAPCSLRTACRLFCSCIDAGRRTLRLRWPPRCTSVTPCDVLPDAQLSALFRLPCSTLYLGTLDCSRAPAPCTTLAALCPTLTALDLSACHLQADLSQLCALPRLTSLTLEDCQHLLDLDALAGLSATCPLSCLVLSNCPNLYDISALSGFRTLTHLDLTQTFGFSDIRPLAACPSLTSLALSTNGTGAMADLGRLIVLPVLNTLKLGCQSVVGVQPLRTLTQVTSLTFSYALLFDIGPLSMPTVVVLNLSLARTRDLRPLAQCRALTCVRLTHCHQISDLAPLAQCPALAELELASCASFQDLLPLAQCASLTVLHLKNCPAFYNLNPLPRCRALTHLQLTSCPGLLCIAAAGSCRSLRSLHIARCCLISAHHLGLVLHVSQRERWWYRAAVVVVDGKPADASLAVRVMLPFSAAMLRLFVVTVIATVLSWLLQASMCARVVWAVWLPTSTVWVVFFAHMLPVTQYDS